MIELILGKMGIGVLSNLIGGALDKIDNPIAKTAAKALGEVDKAIKDHSITPEQQVEANRHIEAMEGLRLDEEKNRISEINETIRAEVVSGDPYVSRMRPTFGYIMAVTWGAQMMAVAYIMIFETSKASVVIEAIESLSGIWAVGLSVLGIYVYKRSDEKKSQQNS